MESDTQEQFFTLKDFTIVQEDGTVAVHKEPLHPFFCEDCFGN
jgi:hypothetical protein